MTNTDKKKKLKVDWSRVATWSLIVVVAGIMFFFNYNVKLETKGGAILVAALSIMLNVLLLVAVFATGIGRRLFKRFFNRLRYRSGKYVNTLWITKNGVLKEKFKKIDADTGAFKIRNKPYTRNPSLLFDFERIPTYIHKEGSPAPLNPFENEDSYAISNSEIDEVMCAGDAFDIKQWLAQNKTLLLFAIGIMILFTAAAAFFGYKIYEMLRDGSYTLQEPVKCVAQNIGESLKNAASGGA